MATIVVSKAEPVPSASQLAVLPFISGLEGFLSLGQGKPNARLTVHRVMYRGSDVYLQQVCDYVGSGSGGAGRIFPVTTGIIGAAFESGSVFHTREFTTRQQALSVLAEDMKATNDKRPIDTIGISFVAVPFIGAYNMPVLVLYGESFELNLFAAEKTKALVAACAGFCRLFDRLSDEGVSGLRNFPLIEPEQPKYVRSGRTVYPQMQMKSSAQPPAFKKLFSFNFEAQL